MAPRSPAFARCKVCTHKKLYKGGCGPLYKKRGNRWGEWGFAAGGFFLDFCESNTCCASNSDDCCESDDGAIAGLVIGIIVAIIIRICCCCFLCPGCYGFERRQKRAPPPENAPRTLESAEEPPVVQGNVVETVAAEKK